MRKYNLVITAVNRVTNGNKAGKHANGHSPENYIDKSVEALMNKAGAVHLPEDFMKIFIYESGSSDLSYLNSIKNKFPQIEIVYSKEKITLVENTNKALTEGSIGAEYVILMQDDVDFTHHAIYKMDE